MRTSIEDNGFNPRTGRKLGRQRRNATFAELVATIGLTLCTIVAVTAVSVGIARARAVGDVLDNESGVFALALVIGVAFLLMGGFTLLTLPGERHRHRH
ncbi:MAG: hypothetical protein ACK4UO_09550 [Pseudolabrys sp.]